MSVITAKVLWRNGQYVANCLEGQGVNCDTLALGSLKTAWIVRKENCCGADPSADITFVNPNDNDALKGVFLQDAASNILVLNAASVEAVADACNVCCGETGTVVAPNYSTIPALTASTVSSFCVTRVDTGDYKAMQQMIIDYYDRTVTINFKSAASGTSKYDVTAYSKPNPVGTDTVATGACS